MVTDGPSVTGYPGRCVTASLPLSSVLWETCDGLRPEVREGRAPALYFGEGKPWGTVLSVYLLLRL